MLYAYTFDLLILTSLDHQFYTKNINCLCYKTSHLRVEVNCTEAPLQLVFPGTFISDEDGSFMTLTPVRSAFLWKSSPPGDSPWSRSGI